MKKDEFERIAETLGGLCLLGCLRGSPADRAGLRYGDVVLEVNGVRTPDWAAYIEATQQRRATMTVRYFRDGAEHTVEFPIDSSDERPSALDVLRALTASGATARLHDEEEDAPLLS